MQVEHFEDGNRFAAALEPLGADAPVEHQFMRTALWPDEQTDAWLASIDGEPQGAMLRLGAGVFATGRTTAVVDAFVGPLADSSAHEVRAEPGLAAMLAGAWGERTGGAYMPMESLRTCVAEEVQWASVRAVQGTISAGRDLTFDQVLPWAVAMVDELGERNDSERLHAAVARRHRLGQYRQWVVNGVARAQLFVSRAAYGYVRIGGVYTPPAHRGRGYAGALTAAVTDEHHRAGLAVMLNTQAHNALTNRLYRRIGFRSRTDLLAVELLD